MQLFVRAQQQHVVDCDEQETVAALRMKVALLEGVDHEDLLLYVNGSPLEDEAVICTLSSQMIEANMGLMGGKVHGSLARAGKVKSQTPKVEPQEKKKTPKGRAKKRITYTRRFVNVTMTGGKRKMNPNPTS